MPRCGACTWGWKHEHRRPLSLWERVRVRARACPVGAALTPPSPRGRGSNAHDRLAVYPCLQAFYGDAQALFGIDFELSARRAGRDHRRQRRRQVDLPQVPHRAGACAARGHHVQGRGDRRPAARRDRAARARAGARGPAPVPEPQRRREPADGRHCRAARGRGTCSACTRCSRSWPRSATSPARRSRAASSRWWRSAARS